MYKQDLMGVQEVCWDKSGTVTGEILFYSMEKQTKFIGGEQDICTPQSMIRI
jgi:hypothetical protein